MAEAEKKVLQIVAENPEKALQEAAKQTGMSASELEVVGSEQAPSLPWQKRYRYQIAYTPPARPAAQVAAAAAAPAAAAPAQGAPGVDGSWSADFRDGSVWLTVSPPSGSGQPVGIQEVLAETKGWPVTSVAQETLTAVIERASGKPEAVASYAVGAEGYVIFVAPSDMAAWLICGNRPPQSEAPDPAIASLKAEGVTHGIDEEAIRSALTTWTPGAAVSAARGSLPVPGTDASVMQTFSPSGFNRVAREDGTIDFFASQLTPSVKEGMPLAVKQPATSGSEGYTIRGKPLPTQPGKDLDLKRMVGKGVALSEDGLQIVAALDGTPSAAGGKYTVVYSLQISGNVDHSTGNVDFPGAVVNQGDIQDSFRVHAGGDITVRGVTGAAILEAEGNILLMSGVFGRDEGKIVAKGNVSGSLLQECSVEVGGDLQVSGEIVRCDVTAKGSVETGATGRIVGGNIVAGVQVVANIVGSPAGRTATHITIRPGEPADEPSESRPRPSVRVKTMVYPPASIVIGEARLTIDSQTPYCMFTESGGQITMAPFA